MPLTCYDSDREVRSQIYDPQGNALTIGELADRFNALERESQEAIRQAASWWVSWRNRESHAPDYLSPAEAEAMMREYIERLLQERSS